MTAARAAAALFGGMALLERAVGYTLGQLQAVTSAALPRATPCQGWDLRTLLGHMDDSLAAMQEALELRHVRAPGRPEDGAGDRAGDGDGEGTVAVLRRRGCQLLGALAGSDENLVWVSGLPVPVRIVASAGAIDVAVHGWDVGRACGTGTPISGDLALSLLRVAPLLVSETDRPERFGEPVAVPPDASPSDRLIGYLGRDPSWHIHHPSTF
jgi:uncharacterized protein (TIGR03086 family)